MVLIFGLCSSALGVVIATFCISEASNCGLLEGVGISGINPYIPANPVGNMTFPACLLLAGGVLSYFVGVLGYFLSGLLLIVLFTTFLVATKPKR